MKRTIFVVGKSIIVSHMQDNILTFNEKITLDNIRLSLTTPVFFPTLTQANSFANKQGSEWLAEKLKSFSPIICVELTTDINKKDVFSIEKFKEYIIPSRINALYYVPKFVDDISTLDAEHNEPSNRIYCTEKNFCGDFNLLSINILEEELSLFFKKKQPPNTIQQNAGNVQQEIPDTIDEFTVINKDETMEDSIIAADELIEDLFSKGNTPKNKHS